jgi:hypothetical protein
MVKQISCVLAQRNQHLQIARGWSGGHGRPSDDRCMNRNDCRGSDAVALMLFILDRLVLHAY